MSEASSRPAPAPRSPTICEKSDGRPFLIDFDNAGPGDPSREIAMVTFEFGRGDAVRQRTL